MFAVKPRKETVFHVVLIAVMFFNAILPMPGSAGSVFAQGSEPTTTASAMPADTETPTPQPTTSPTETAVSPVETATPPPPTPVTDTSTPAVDTSPSAVKIDTPLLSLSTEPDSIGQGDEFTLNWAIDGLALDEYKLLLNLTLPKGFSLPDKYEGEFDPSTRILILAVAALNGKIPLIADGFASDAIFEAQLLEGDATIAKDSLLLSFQEQFTVAKDGGIVQALTSKVKVEFPPDVLSENATVRIGKPSQAAMPAYTLLGQPFEITAVGEQSGSQLKHFAKELSIYYSYRWNGKSRV